jgi:membrane-associated protease RseP (regulator of RpoE activity)
VIDAVVGIFVHELGHLLAARILSMGVTGLSVGFGPELIDRRRTLRKPVSIQFP